MNDNVNDILNNDDELKNTSETETEKTAQTEYTEQSENNNETVKSESEQNNPAQAETVQPEISQDPYSKYNFPGNNSYYSGYNNYNPAGGNYGYSQGTAQGQQFSGQQFAGQQFAGQQFAGQQYRSSASYQYQQNRQGSANLADTLYPGTASHHPKKEKKEQSKGVKFLIGAAMSVAFGLIAAGVFIAVTYFYKEQNPELFSNNSHQVQVTTTDNKENAHLNLDPATDKELSSTSVLSENTFTSTDVSKVVETAMPSIVSIECKTTIYDSFYGAYDADTAGSGIIIEKSDKELMIATNNHVVENAKEINVTFCDGTTAKATVKGTDEVIDLAVIAIKLSDLSDSTNNAIAIAKLGNSDEVKIGEMAIAIGNSLGYGQSVTVGYISAKDRELTVDGVTYKNLLQTDAAINPGNSGGALVNIKGEVIGINNGKVGGTQVEGIGYAIPISRAQNILADFATRETLTTDEQGFLGVTIKTVSETTAKMYNWPVGAYIASIIDGSAAQTAGLQVCDIITSINDTQIKSAEKLIERIQSLRHGAEITVTIQRLEDGEFVEKTFSVVLGKRPSEENTD